MEQSSEFTSWNSSRWLKEIRTYTPTLQKVTYELIRICWPKVFPTQETTAATALGSTPLLVLFQLGFTCCFPGDSVTLSLCQGISRWLTCFYVERSESLKHRCNRYTYKKNNEQNVPVNGEPCVFVERNQESFVTNHQSFLGWYLCQVSKMYFFHVPFLPNHGSWRFLPPRVCFQKQGFNVARYM